MSPALSCGQITVVTIGRLGARKRRASIEDRFTRLKRTTETFDRLLVWGQTKCRDGNMDDALPRILEAEALWQVLGRDLAELRRQIREAGVDSALRQAGPD